ncbi:Nuclear inhibitor of protein phosphatase 1 [Microtus ochrogaster]|uniref:Nuclear inhibitor of protein phosphatase 1 n=1 Tax=Microtus ochrogaster TaxID=79684 RepID=A0A8J6KRJ3_MICOH|nr:Nuclear inhibitor of protein phosphatase 1 [Microtus ochrogaster]
MSVAFAAPKQRDKGEIMPATIQKMLDENNYLIQCIMDYQGQEAPLWVPSRLTCMIKKVPKDEAESLEEDPGDIPDGVLTLESTRHIKRIFLVDLNSTGGTFLGHIRVEPQKPQEIPIDSAVSFHTSTRHTLCERSLRHCHQLLRETRRWVEGDDELKGLREFPEEETELDNLTEFNTAHSKRISVLTIEGNLDIQRPKRKRKNSQVTFSEDDEIINSEDVDPVGGFQNMVQTVVVPVKKKRMEGSGSLGPKEAGSRRIQNFAFSGGLYGGLPPTHSETGSQPHGIHGTALIGGLPMPYPNLAPDVDLTPVVPSAVTMNPTPNPAVYSPEAVNEPRKKKYAKEAWPGKKPTASLLI